MIEHNYFYILRTLINICAHYHFYEQLIHHENIKRFGHYNLTYERRDEILMVLIFSIIND